MTLYEILKAKGGVVYTIEPMATLAEVAHRLVTHNVGSLLVCNPDCTARDELLGIITERDILHVTAEYHDSWSGRKAADHMSTRLITATPDDSVEAVMGLMTENRVRHLPVMADDRLVGIVSIGDVVKAQHDRLAIENRFMKDYIQQGGQGSDCACLPSGRPITG
jgi:CBS domain-containing protein